MKGISVATLASLTEAQTFQHEQVIGAAINAKVRWSVDAHEEKLDLCVSALSFEGNDGWIGIGFGGHHGNGKKWMLDEDIVVGFVNGDGESVVEPMYSDAEAGIPSGKNKLQISNSVFTHSNGIMEMCFERPVESGYNPVSDGAKVIWATGPVVNGTIQYHGKDGHDDSGTSQMHRSDEVAAFNWLSGPPQKFTFHSVIGHAVDAAVQWTPNTAKDTVSMCVSSKTFEGNDGWLGIGFGGEHGNGKKWMLDEDIVVGYSNQEGQGVVRAMYSDAEAGIPVGQNTLNISNAVFTNQNGVMEVCFERPINGGHNPLNDTAKVIWATGPVVNGTIQYHGKDGHDDSGASQMHRSDEVVVFPWISGPERVFKYERIIGAAINMTVKWTPDAEHDSVDMCVSANTFEGNDGWIGIGFGGDHGNGKKWMLDEDIVVGYVNAAGVAVVQPLWSDAESGAPVGTNSLAVSDGVFTNENGIMEVCFKRAISSGHNPLTDDAKVIWATGPVVNGTIQYHGKDGHDDSGKSQMHRSDEVAAFPWISGPERVFKYESVIGAAINMTAKWTPYLEDDSVDMCVSANTFEGNDGWIGIGFGGDHGNGKKWMLDEDIVVGYVNAAGVAVVQPLWSDAESGAPVGANSLAVSDGAFTNENGVMEVCFKRAISSGHNPLTDDAKVIWATGPVVNGTIQYHGKDGHDDSGKSQMHRSDEVAAFPWISGVGSLELHV